MASTRSYPSVLALFSMKCRTVLRCACAPVLERASGGSPCLPRAEVLVSVTEDIRMSKPSDLVQGTLDMLLLNILALEPMNGFAVRQRLTQVSGDVLQVSDGSLYPALHKLEQEGWITAEWKTSEHGRRAKYYSLTR